MSEVPNLANMPPVQPPPPEETEFDPVPAALWIITLCAAIFLAFVLNHHMQARDNQKTVVITSSP